MSAGAVSVQVDRCVADALLRHAGGSQALTAARAGRADFGDPAGAQHYRERAELLDRAAAILAGDRP